MEAVTAKFSRRAGFHAHDNLGLALANSLAAIDAGATIVDSSVKGMGRGAGNTRTEQLLAALAQDGGEIFTAEPLFPLVDDEFRALQKRYAWGSSVPYLFTGSHSIHPTYAQELIVRGLGDRAAVAVLAAIKDHPGKTSFDARILQQAIAATPEQPARGTLRRARAQ
jgi:4-hydroxy 2-oxovalerate aldolase